MPPIKLIYCFHSHLQTYLTHPLDPPPQCEEDPDLQDLPQPKQQPQKVESQNVTPIKAEDFAHLPSFMEDSEIEMEVGEF